MKKIVLVLALFVGICSSCSKDDVETVVLPDELGRTINEISGHDTYGVSVWNKINQVNINKYGYHDVTGEKYNEYIYESLSTLCNDTNEVKFKWNTNAKIKEVKRHINHNPRNPETKYEVSSIITIEPTIQKNLIIEGDVELPSITVKRRRTIQVFVHEFIGLNLGTNRSKLDIQKDLSPSLSILNSNEFINTSNKEMTLVEFNNNNLTKIYYLFNAEFSKHGFTKYGIPKAAQFSNNNNGTWRIVNPQTWKYGSLNMEALNLDLTAYGLGVVPAISAQ